MALTIYTISDPVLAGSALTSMAMFFGQDSWVATLIKTGLMISLLLILAQTVVQKGLRLDIILVQLIVVWTMFIPKTTVQIEQFDNTAPPRVVDNVPYAIAYPAALAGTFSLFMTQKIEQVMVSVNGDYLSVSGDVHPFAPARVLLSFAKCPTEPLGCLPQNLVETMRLATRYCAGPTMAKVRFAESNAVLTDMANTLTEQGSTVIYDDSNPFVPGGGGGRAASCAEVSSYLKNYEQYISNSTGTNEITESLSSLASNANIRNTKSSILPDGRINYDTALGMVNKVTGADANIDTQSMINMMTYAVADSLKYESSTPIDQPLSIRRDSGLYDWAKTEAAQSMLVSTTAPKFMDVLFFVFIASTPFVLFVVVANPQSGMKVAASYVLFGLWTQSWIPMMAIITSWYQRDILSMPAPKLNAPLTAQYMAALMRQVMTSTIAAGNMIQNAPYLMFAILSGSMFAMSNMISKAVPSGSGSLSAEGGGGKGSAAGGGIIGGTGPGAPALAQRSAVIGADNAIRGGMTGDAVGPRGDVAANLPGLASLGGSAEVGAATTAASSTTASARQKLEQTVAAAVGDVQSMITAGGLDKRGGELASYLKSRGYSASSSEADNTITINGQTFSLGASQSSTSTTSMGGNASAGVRLDLAKALPALAGTSVGATGPGIIAGNVASMGLDAMGISLTGDLAAFMSQKHDNAQAAQLSNKKDFANQRNRQQGNTFSGNSGEQGSTGFNGSSGGTWSRTGQTAKQLSNTLSTLSGYARDLNKSDQLVRNATNSSAGRASSQIKGSDVVAGWADNAIKKSGQVSAKPYDAQKKVEDAVAGALSPSQLAQFQQLAEANYKQLEQSFGAALNKDQLAGAAAWRALTTMSNSGEASDKIRAMEGMGQMAAAAGMGSEVLDSLKAARSALEISAGVGKNLKDMEAVVKPGADQASQRAEAELSPSAQDKFKGQVAGLIAAGEKAADGGKASATAGYDGMPKQAEDAKKDFNDKHPRQSVDYPNLAAGFEAYTEAQKGALVRPSDARDYVATRNPEMLAPNPAGATGANSVPPPMSNPPSPPPPPAPTMPASLGGVIGGATTQGLETVRSLGGSFGGAIGSGVQAVQGMVPGGGGGGGLPQLGNPGGNISAAPRAGGGSGGDQPSQQDGGSAKPNLKNAPANGGSPRSIPGTK